MRIMLLAVLAVSLAAETPEVAKVGGPAVPFSLMSATGETIALPEKPEGVVVLEWVNFDCPFVKKHYHSGNMQKLQKKWTEAGVTWYSIASSAAGKQGHFTGEALTERIAKEGGHRTAYLIDDSGKVGRAYGAKTTPQMAIISAEGTVIYNGAIDSLSGTDPEEISKATNYVDQALTAHMAGKDIAKAETKPYGCSVKYGK